MSKKPFVIYSGSEAEPIKDEIKSQSKAVDLSGRSVKFKMRHAENSDLKVNANATVDDAVKGKVSYSWNDADLDTPGEYFAWWEISGGGTNFDSQEFLVIVTKHSPGLRIETGSIYQHAKSIVPITWSALEKAPQYGDKLLQSRIEVAKDSVLPAALPVADESALNLKVQIFIAKIAVTSVIPAGVDYWMNQYEQVTTQGTQGEVASYPDRVAALWKIHEHLLGEIVADRDEVEDIIGLPTFRPSTGVPGVSDGDIDRFTTPNPHADFYGYSIARPRGPFRGRGFPPWA